MNRLSTDEARQLTIGIQGDAEALRSMLTEAHDGRAWEALGYQREADWQADTLGTDPIPGLTAPTGPVKARVSQPGKRRSSSPIVGRDRSIGRTQVEPNWK